MIRNDFAKRLREQTGVEFADGLVNIFLGGGDSSLCVAVSIQRQ